MENLIKVNCASTTYLCNFLPNTNFCKEEKLFVGVVNDNSKNLNLYKSLLKFYIPSPCISSAKNIYLFLFLENIYPTTCNSLSISLSSNNEDLDISTVTWPTLPKRNKQSINIDIPTKPIKKYLKIDISNIIKSLNSNNNNNNNYNISIEPMNLNSASMIQFSSSKCECSPYLVLVNDEFNYRITPNDFETYKNDYFNENISELNQSIKDEISQLKTSVSHNVLDLKASVNDSITDINNSIKNVTETLSLLSNRIARMSEIIETITAESSNN